MKAVVWLGPRRMELQNEPEPQPQAGEVILRVDAVGICGSELSGYLGQNSLRVPPLVMGHEFAGTITANGAGVTDLAIGDRVTVNPLSGCGVCALCRRGYGKSLPEAPDHRHPPAGRLRRAGRRAGRQLHQAAGWA